MKKHPFVGFERSKIALSAFCFLFVVISFRLLQIQVLNFSRYKSLAREQHWDAKDVPAKRGSIYTSDGYPVAYSEPYYYMSVYPHLIKDSETFFKDLKRFEFIPPEKIVDLNSAFLDYPDRPAKLAFPLRWEEKEDIKRFVSSGIKFDVEYKRSYPEHKMLSNVLGFIGKDKLGDEVGYYGLEQYYDGYLKGHDGLIVREKTASGDPILFAGGETNAAANGSDIYLTVDRTIQFIVEKNLTEGVDRYNAKTGTGIVVDSRTGEIKAMVSVPGFDPAFKEEAFDPDIVRNQAISVLYEPGSVIKPITMAAAIDLGLVDPNTTFNDTGKKTYSDYQIDNWDGKHHGVITMTQVLQLSNNIAIAWLGTQVKSENLIKYFGDFGLGKKTDIDLEGEERGIMYAETNLKDIELVNASFGQGISLTPLQVVMAFSAIANEGKLMKPYIVSKIKTGEEFMENKPVVVGRPISEKTSNTMVEMLTQAVAGGEAKYFISKKYNIAGKTGTAQVPIPGGYDSYRTNATFVGFFPSYPEFVMLIKLEEPSSPSGYAAETAVPLWMKIAEEIAVYEGLKPDKN